MRSGAEAFEFGYPGAQLFRVMGVPSFAEDAEFMIDGEADVDDIILHIDGDGGGFGIPFAGFVAFIEEDVVVDFQRRGDFKAFEEVLLVFGAEQFCQPGFERFFIEQVCIFRVAAIQGGEGGPGADDFRMDGIRGGFHGVHFRWGEVIREEDGPFLLHAAVTGGLGYESTEAYG